MPTYKLKQDFTLPNYTDPEIRCIAASDNCGLLLLFTKGDIIEGEILKGSNIIAKENYMVMPVDGIYALPTNKRAAAWVKEKVFVPLTDLEPLGPMPNSISPKNQDEVKKGITNSQLKFYAGWAAVLSAYGYGIYKVGKLSDSAKNERVLSGAALAGSIVLTISSINWSGTKSPAQQLRQELGTSLFVASSSYLAIRVLLKQNPKTSINIAALIGAATAGYFAYKGMKPKVDVKQQYPKQTQLPVK